MARRLAVALLGVPPVAYRQDTAGGALTHLGDVGTAAVRDLAYTPAGDYLATAQTTSQYAVYRRDADVHTALTRPVSISTAATGVAWHADGQRHTYTFGAANRAYAFLRTGDSYAYAGANVGGNPTSSPQQRAVEYSGDLLAIGIASAPMIFVYSVASTGVLTRITTGTPAPHSAVVALAFSPDGSVLALGCTTAPRLILYSRSGTTFTRLPDPVQPSTSSPGGMAFSPDGTRFVYSAGDLYYFTHDGAGTLTRSTDPDVQPPGTTLSGVAFDHEGTQVAACSSGAPFVTLYTHTGTALVAQPAPATAPAVEALSVAWTPDDGAAPAEVALGPAALTAGAHITATLRAAQPLSAALTAGADTGATLRTATPLAAAVQAGAASTATLRSAAALRAGLEAGAVQDATLRAAVGLAAELGIRTTPLATLRAAARLRAALAAGAHVTATLRAPASRELEAVTGSVRVTRRTGQAHVTERVTGAVRVTNRTGVAHL